MGDDLEAPRAPFSISSGALSLRLVDSFAADIRAAAAAAAADERHSDPALPLRLTPSTDRGSPPPGRLPPSASLLRSAGLAQSLSAPLTCRAGVAAAAAATATMTVSPTSVATDALGVASLQVNADLLALRNIDTAAQVFDCTLMLQIRWTETAPYEEGWEPDIAFTNTVDDLRVQLRETRRSAGRSGGVVQAVHVMVVSGTFAEHYELRQFPMDCQRLHIKAVLLNCPAQRTPSARPSPASPTLSERSSCTATWFTKRFRLTRGLIMMQPDSFLDTDSWRLIERMDVTHGRSTQGMDADAISYCTFTVHLTVERMCIYYFWNIVFPISLEGVMALFTCFLDADDISTKTQITITIILTIFAVKFSSTQYLPPVNCMTYMDQYFIGSTLMMCLVMAQNLLVYKAIGEGGDDAAASRLNLWTGALLAGVWVAVHAALYPVFLLPRMRSRWVTREIENGEVHLPHDPPASAEAPPPPCCCSASDASDAQNPLFGSQPSWRREEPRGTPHPSSRLPPL